MKLIEDNKNNLICQIISSPITKKSNTIFLIYKFLIQLKKLVFQKKKLSLMTSTYKKNNQIRQILNNKNQMKIKQNNKKEKKKKIA